MNTFSFLKQLQRYVFVLVLLIIFSPRVAIADDTNDEIPSIIIAGLNEYKANGPEAAIIAWIKGSPFEGSKEALSQANRFKEIETFYGSYTNYHLIHIAKLTPSTKIVYFSMDFENGPVFAVFTVFKSKKGWIVTGRFNFHTEPQQILPSSLLGK